MIALKEKHPQLYHYYDKFLLWLMLAFFAGHMINHSLIYAGNDIHLAFMDILRTLYRFPILEALLVLAIYRQIAAGFRQLKRFGVRSKGRFRILAWSGVYLIGFLVIHLSSVAIGRWVFGVDTNLYFGAAGFRDLPEALFFYPYYFLAIWMAFAHMGSVIWLRSRSSNEQFADLAYKLGLWGGLVFSILLVLGLSGVLVPFEVPAAYLM